MFVRHFGSRVVLASEKVKFPHPPTPIFGVLCLTGTGQKNIQDLVTRKWALGAGRSTAYVLAGSLTCRASLLQQAHLGFLVHTRAVMFSYGRLKKLSGVSFLRTGHILLCSMLRMTGAKLCQSCVLSPTFSRVGQSVASVSHGWGNMVPPINLFCASLLFPRVDVGEDFRHS